MARSSRSSVKSMNHLLTKINVVKFDGTNNFEMWRCEVMDALTTSNLENFLRLEENPEETSEKDWNKMNQTACGVIRSYLTQDTKYHVLYETSARRFERSSRKSI